jgi:hypothetical protein
VNSLVHPYQEVLAITEHSPRPAWHVCGLDRVVLHTAPDESAALRWAMADSGASTVGTRQEIGPHDYWYLLIDPATGRDCQVRVVRADRAAQLGIHHQHQPDG